MCRAILSCLPEWFGIAESVERYVSVSDDNSTVIASCGGTDVGFVTVLCHSPYSAEIYVMGVKPDYHRRGVGRQLVRHVEHCLSQAGIEYLQVKTLAPSRKDENYERTRAFYLSCGFRPLEEFPTLWSPGNPALQMVKALGL